MVRKFKMEGTMLNMGSKNDTIIIIKFHARNMVEAAHKAERMCDKHGINQMVLSRGWE